MWMDHRAVAEAAEINATHDPALAYVGGEVSVEMELPKMLWLRRHFPDRHAAARRFFDLADYMVWRATGADVASVCTLTCKWNYLAHEQRFSDTPADGRRACRCAARRCRQRFARLVRPRPAPGRTDGAEHWACRRASPWRPASSTHMPAGRAHRRAAAGRAGDHQRHLVLPSRVQPAAGDGARRMGAVFRRHAARLVAE